MKPLALTVISGYLGAGKTTLINRILAEDHGLKLLVMVNDFGAINIDAELLVAADEDTLTLSNGCVCCTMGADLFMALGDALDRRPRPDHLLIEASGVADPVRIANAAKAEPELYYGGIVTLVDGLQFEDWCADALIGPQVSHQVEAADLVVVSKTDSLPDGLHRYLQNLSPAPALLADDLQHISRLLFDMPVRTELKSADLPHPAYVSWSYRGDACLSREALNALLAARPVGLFRFKGLVRDAEEGFWEVQVVGRHVAVRKVAEGSDTKLVAIGLGTGLRREEIEQWWQGKK